MKRFSPAIVSSISHDAIVDVVVPYWEKDITVTSNDYVCIVRESPNIQVHVSTNVAGFILARVCSPSILPYRSESAI